MGLSQISSYFCFKKIKHIIHVYDYGKMLITMEALSTIDTI